MPVFQYGDKEWDGVPHLGLMMGDGSVMRIPRGATLLVIEDPTRLDKVLPLILTKVSMKAIDFTCACGNPDCTRKLRYRAERAGYHPSMHQRKSTIQESDE